ncbi:unnamed protein product [Tilletia controversa]|uniref:Protein transport protein SFT2 n=3 Tax=Tilletia TaxID=13289 RepID=A0A8X7MLF1_9BASI|nr:hypothetical protein CF328_g6992 [Tilletia controversa]KAE8191454.1 hypothetical protein CF336_g4861 [Tilletia laevis]KAE8258975.1 hypothetical protein A4X03_0g4230 [Tilletia caries]KAE8198963.1 hypothetical protein CF335_g4275 [Tilletia laevis]KAE8240874.1 hypothetical protein A4X06_0g7763 [Tilletia controversa]
MPSWLPGFSSSSTTADSGAAASGGSGTAFGSAAGSGGAGGSRWLNLDTNVTKNMGGDLTGENSAFTGLGFEMTRQQRLMGFVGCLIGGFVVSLLGTLLLITGSLASFAILYSIGIIISLVGTGFLIGFAKQLKSMFAPVRVVATLIFLGAFAMVWVSAFALDSTILAVVFVVVLYLAYIWYSLSYIPGARAFFKSIFNKIF